MHFFKKDNGITFYNIEKTFKKWIPLVQNFAPTFLYYVFALNHSAPVGSARLSFSLCSIDVATMVRSCCYGWMDDLNQLIRTH
jgi:hypothetical protein